MTRAAAVRDHVTAHLDQVLEDLRFLVHLESPSSDKPLLDAALDAIQAWVIERLGRPAMHVRHEGGTRGDVVEMTFDGTAEGHVLAICHYDTVWPRGTIDTWPMAVADGRITGPGVLDMKAGLVQTVWMLRALRELDIPHPGVRLLLNGDEEIGSVASREHIEAAARASLLTLIPEPSAMGDAKVQRKGMVFGDVTVTGVESHAGLDPFAGASAVHELARLIPRIVELADHEAGTTVNVGLVAGGSGRNVIAGRATAEVDVRITDPAEGERVAAALEALTATDERCQVHIDVDYNRPPMNPTSRTEEALGLLREVAADLGERIGTVAVGGASDGNFVAALDLPVIDGLGGIGEGPHARHEYITIDGLPRQTALMAGLLERLA